MHKVKPNQVLRHARAHAAMNAGDPAPDETNPTILTFAIADGGGGGATNYLADVTATVDEPCTFHIGFGDSPTNAQNANPVPIGTEGTSLSVTGFDTGVSGFLSHFYAVLYVTDVSGNGPISQSAAATV